MSSKSFLSVARQGGQTAERAAFHLPVAVLPLMALPVQRLPQNLTPDKLRLWQTTYVKAAGDSPEAVKRAKTSANSIAGNAARLFTPTMLEHYHDAGFPVIENPFAKLKPFKKGDNRYISRVNPEEVLRVAHDDLLGPLPARARPLTGVTKEAAAFEAADRPQMYRVILLGTMTGLRRRELDRLQWGHIDFARNTLMVQSTADGSVKGVGSTPQVDLPEDLTAALEAWKKPPPACT